MSLLLTKKKNELFNSAGSDMAPMLRRQMAGLIDSWSIRFDYHHMMRNGYCVYPVRSYIQNTGLDGSGTNCGKSYSSRNPYADSAHIQKINSNLSEVTSINAFSFADQPDKIMIRILNEYFRDAAKPSIRDFFLNYLRAAIKKVTFFFSNLFK